MVKILFLIIGISCSSNKPIDHIHINDQKETFHNDDGSYTIWKGCKCGGGQSSDYNAKGRYVGGGTMILLTDEDITELGLDKIELPKKDDLDE